MRAHCLGLAGATEDHPFGPGALVFKVGGKLFAIVGENEDPVTVSLKCDPEEAVALRAAYDAVAPGYHLNKRHWNTITLDGTVPERAVRDWIDDSYDLVVETLPRRVASALQIAPRDGSSST